MAPPRKSPRTRILQQHDRVGDCWIWTGTKHRDGYGVMTVGRGTQKRAHRVSFEEFTGPIPEGMIICHRCDTPLCVNPAHLFVGTHSDNAVDRESKSRRMIARGADHPNTKVSDAQCSDIRRLRSEGQTLGRIAEQFGISFQHVSAICREEARRAAA